MQNFCGKIGQKGECGIASDLVSMRECSIACVCMSCVLLLHMMVIGWVWLMYLECE